jgi:hypothetical protein
MPRVVHFEIQASEPERILPFYQSLLGWKFTKWEGPWEYWLIVTGSESPGIDGGLLKRRGPRPEKGQPVNAFVCTVDVPDLDGCLGRIAELQGTLALPKVAVPGIGWLAYVADPDGNIVGLMQSDPTAA